MLKAIFLDLDETLCATSKANDCAIEKIEKRVSTEYPTLNAHQFTQRYIDGIYKRINAEIPQIMQFLPDETAFRNHLIEHLFYEQHLHIDFEQACALQVYFEEQRMAHFYFFPKISSALTRLRKKYKLIVITNGPTFSQYPKIEAVNLADYVDYIIVGGAEPEEKPHISIYAKALSLAGCKPQEAVHIGDSLQTDMAGAKESGVGSIWINSFIPQEIAQARQMQVDYILDNPSDLESAISFFEQQR